MNNLISREAATATVSYRFAVVASRLATRGATIPTAYAVGYMLSSLRDCEMAQLRSAPANESLIPQSNRLGVELVVQEIPPGVALILRRSF